MSTQVQFRRGTTLETTNFTGASGEVTVDTTKNVCVVHDASKAGGYPLMREDGVNSALALGSPANCSLKFVNNPGTGIYSPGVDQVAIATAGVQRFLIDSSGNTTYANSLTAASFIPTGSSAPINGLYLPGANKVALSTAGTGRLFVDASGNVGIGTSSPATLLHLSNTSQIRHTCTSTANAIGFWKDGTPSFAAEIGCGSATGLASALKFDIYNGSSWNTAVTVDSSSRVGIGTSSPLTKLDVRSGVITAGSNSSPNGSEILRGYYTNTDGALAVIGTEYSSGGIVIGSAVKPSTSVTDAFLSSTTVNIARGAYTIAGNIHKWYIGAAQTVAENSSVSTSEVMRIDSSGRLGIGTTAPGAALDVSTTTSAKLNLTYPGFGIATLASDSTGALILQSDEANAQANSLIQFKVDGTERLRITSDGKVGIGTSSPQKELQITAVAPTIRLEESSASAKRLELSVNSAAEALISAPQSSSQLLFATVGSERLRITSAGLVGVGTSSPLSNLVVSNGSNKNIEFQPGSTSYLFAYDRTAGDYLDLDVAGQTVRFSTDNGTERMRIDSSGRVGIGSNNPQSLLHLETDGTALRIVRGSAIGFAYNTGTAATDPFRIQSNGGSVDLYSAAGQPITFSAGSTEKARLTSSGQWLVGTSSGSDNNALLKVQGNVGGTTGTGWIDIRRGLTTPASGSQLGLLSFSDASGNHYAFIEGYTDADTGTNDYPGRLVFSTTADGASSPTERMRIDSTGTHQLYGINDTIYSRTNRGAGTLYVTFAGVHSATNTTNGTASCYIYSNGNVVNTNNSYGALSDLKLKENIVDASSQWSDIKALQVRKYNFKEETNQPTHTQIGLVAQEAEVVSPGLVFESPDRDEDGNDLGTTTKSVNYSVLYMKAVKALQEAMERIETLEAKVAALESK